MTGEKSDIRTRADIQNLVDRFYDKVFQDPILSPYFTQAVSLDWEKHRHVMYDFWQGILLGEHAYQGNPIVKHLDLDQKMHLTPEAFGRWLSLFQATVDELHQGEIAHKAKTRAQSIANVMQVRLANR